MSRAALVLALLAAGAGGAWADRLSRSACKELKIDLADLLARGTAREDMKRGPEWAKANLTQDKLNNIKRLIKLEEQLEFRCKMRRRRILAVAPSRRSFEKKAEEIAAPPVMPEKKPSTLSQAAKPALATIKKRAAAKTAAVKKRRATASARKRRSSQRKSRGAYVSPREVNPLYLSPLVSSR